MRARALAHTVTAAVSTALLVGSLLLTPQAGAAEPAPPVAVGDTISLYPGQAGVINVLANDSAPSGQPLDLCRFPEGDRDSALSATVLAIPISPAPGGKTGDVLVALDADARGTSTIEYYVCDLTHLTPATLTVTVKAVAPVDVRKIPGHPGRLRVTNHNTQAVALWYGDPRASRPDHKVRIPAGRSRVVRVQRHRIAWIALIGGGGGKASMFSSPGIADYGIVRGIKLKGKPLPAPKDGDDPDFRSRALHRGSARP